MNTPTPLSAFERFPRVGLLVITATALATPTFSLGQLEEAPFSVYSPEIGSPPAYVLDTSRSGASGFAELSTSEDGALTLNIGGVNDTGERIRLSLTCSPRV